MKKRCPKLTSIQSLSIISLLCWQLGTVGFALDQSTGPGGSNVQAVHNAGYTGQGVSVGLISADHTLVEHEAFAGQADWYDATGQSIYEPVNHDTSVGGIICSRGGAAYPEAKGNAPSSSLVSVRVVTDDNQISTNWLKNGLDHLLSQQCQVVVTAIQFLSSSVTPDGDNFWTKIYDYYAFQNNLIFAMAAGNGDSAVTVFGDAYNGITTGGLLQDTDGFYYQVGSTSNPGPTADGRQKPDIAAPSQDQWGPLASSATSWGNASPSSSGQTSWSAPQTGGVAAVLLSYANASAESADNQNVVIKAVMVNATFPNIVSKAGTPTTGLTWHTDRGYGRLDAKRAYNTLISPKISPGASTGNPSGWAYDAVSSGQQDNFTISGIKNERLLVTLTWNRRIEWNDKPGPGNGTIQESELEVFLANLDLEIYDPDGTLISPAASTLDNLEKVDLLLTKTGDYKVRVVNQSSTESANYALAFEVLPLLEADFNIDYVVDSNDLASLAQFWLESGCIDSTACELYDLIDNDTIDLGDFSRFANHWLDFDPRYYSP